jgi:hypothetical protein
VMQPVDEAEEANPFAGPRLRGVLDLCTAGAVGGGLGGLYVGAGGDGGGGEGAAEGSAEQAASATLVQQVSVS